MDGDFVLDLEDVIENIENSEVMSFFFPTFRKALVIDARSNAEEGPLVRIMPMVASPQERAKSIRRLRPGFPRVRALTVIPWPRYVESLVNLGIWDRIVQRLARSGHQDTAAFDATLQELRRLEQAELAAVVRGESYHTLWSAE